jgi:predicted glycosyltransferase involved in capsule biosynthesis
MFKSLEKADLKSMHQSSFTVVVPFREQVEQKRGEQLKKFLNHFDKLGYPVLVVEQEDGKKFNRGMLLNIGADLVESDYVIFHDVDLIPKKAVLPYYEVFPDSPIHIGKTWREKYDSETFLGGVISISQKDLKAINGFPNNFWGWGGEDDAMRIRMKRNDITILQPTLEKGFTDLPHVDTRTNPEWKNMEKWEGMKLEKMGKNKSGLSNLKYKIVKKEPYSENMMKVTVEI